jgi:hypothetical protein
MPDEKITNSGSLTTPRGGTEAVKSYISSFFGNSAKKEVP